MISGFVDAFTGADESQYMVEFALTFVIFVFFLLFVIDLSLFIYNHNVLYHGTVSAVEVAANGASNDEIKDELHRAGISNYLPSPTSRLSIDDISITPNEEILRVRGKQVEVELQTTMGLLLLGVYPMTLDVPFSSRQLITQTNDADRDGCKDSLEGSGVSCDSYRDFGDTYRKDHDNNGRADIYRFDGIDDDADDDGSPSPQADTVAVAYIENPPQNCVGYYIYRPNNSHATGGSYDSCGSPEGIDEWESWFDGWYHAPEVWDNDFVAQDLLFKRKVPSWSVKNSDKLWHIRVLQTEHDRDNDGWIDKYDGDYDDATEH